MKTLSIALIMLVAIAGCTSPIEPTQVNYIYQYGWHNPLPFTDNGGGDSHWFNTVRNHTLNSSEWIAREGFTSLAPFTGNGSYSYLTLNFPIDTVGSPTFIFSVKSCGENVTGRMKINAYTGSGFTTPLVIDLSTLRNGIVEYTLPSSWVTVNIMVFADSNGYTPTLKVSNTVIQ